MVFSTKLLVLFIFIMQCYCFHYNTYYGQKKIYSLSSDEFVQVKDLDKNLNALKRVIDFSLQNKDYVDFTVHVGFFLLQVNLKWTLKNKSRNIPKELRSDLISMLDKAERILNNYRKRKPQSSHIPNKKPKTLMDLFNDQTTWINNMKPFNSVDPAYKTTRIYDREPTMYKTYIESVFSYDLMKPTPPESDQCLHDIAKHAVNVESSLTKCNISGQCLDTLVNGSSYGYAITHRLLWILSARLARGCFIISEWDDRVLSDQLCSTIYNEAEYIAAHAYELYDLMYEQMCLCGLNSNKLFFRRSWTEVVLENQTKDGCFKNMSDEFTKKVNNLTKKFYEVVKNATFTTKHGCNLHVTSVATGAISSTVRFIIDTYF